MACERWDGVVCEGGLASERWDVWCVRVVWLVRGGILYAVVIIFIYNRESSPWLMRTNSAWRSQ